MQRAEDLPIAAGKMPVPGDPAPLFTARSPVNERYVFDSVAGRYVVLCFFASAGDPTSRGILDGILQNRRVFDDTQASFFGISIDPEDERQQRVAEFYPGIRYFWDFDKKISRLYGRVDDAQYLRISVILDERLRIFAVVPFTTDPAQHVAQLLAILAQAPTISADRAAQVPAPVLVIPRVFEPALCKRLIEYYNEGGATDSGFMREENGRTVGRYDYSHKRRFDKDIVDEELKNACMHRIFRRVLPEIRRAFQFDVTRIERHIIACYDGDQGGHFRAHRDNTTKGTAHRKFAVSLVLNTGEFEGGGLCFPEFGLQTYHPPAGGAVVFSCSLLHAATPVTSGKRYCYLPFLYDDAAAKIREDNAVFFEDS